jgi:hypothetical protein
MDIGSGAFGRDQPEIGSLAMAAASTANAAAARATFLVTFMKITYLF